MIADVGEPMMTSDGVSTVAGGGMSMSVGDVESMSIAGGESTTTGDAGASMMTGEGAGKSVDPDPVVSTVSSN
jgi:hypothetical protein